MDLIVQKGEVSSFALSEEAAIGFHFGEAVGKEYSFVMSCGDGNGLIGDAARRVAEAVGRIVNDQKPSGPNQGFEKQYPLLETLERITTGKASSF